MTLFLTLMLITVLLMLIRLTRVPPGVAPLLIRSASRVMAWRGRRRCLPRWAGVLGAVLASGAVAAGATAQRGAPPASVDINPAPLAPFADPDTTRDIIGHVAFTRYTTPGQCLGAVFVAKQELVREPESWADTLFGPASIRDRVPAPVRAIGERCRTKVAANASVPRELQNVFMLATLLADSVGGDAARERWFAGPQTLEDRGQTPIETHAKRLDSAIKTYMNRDLAGPLRTPYGGRAHALFAQLDKMGPPARNERLGVQEYMLGTESDWTVQQTGYLPDQHQAFQNWLAFLAGIDSVGGLENGAWKYGAEGITSSWYVLRARMLLDGNRAHLAPFADSVVKALPKLKDVGAWMVAQAHGLMAGVGDTVPQLHGSAWYNAGRDTLWPMPGQFSLLVTRDLDVRSAALVRRLAARYGARLRMVVVVKTKGYWDREGVETGPRTPAQEMAQDSAYYFGHFNLAAMLTVEEAPFRQLPNGWWVQSAPVQYERQWDDPAKNLFIQNEMVLVDSTGKLFSNLPLDEADAYAFIDLMMGLKPPGLVNPTK